MGKQTDAYKSNGSIPAAGSVYNYTKEELQEYLKCSKDPVYFIKTYMKIIDVDKGLVPFNLHDYQEKMVRSYSENRFNITLASRQIGKSSTVVAFFLHYILFNVNVNACMSANKQKIAVDLLGRLKLAYENLPRFLQQGVVKWAATEVELENGSRIFAAATSSSSVRGGSYNCVSGDSKVVIKYKNDEYRISLFELTNLLKTQSHPKEPKQKKLMKIIPNNKNYQILTENGFKNFDGIGISKTQPTIKLYFENGDFLQCTSDHKIKTNNGYIAADEIELFKTKIITNDKKTTSLIYKEIGETIDVYDVLEVEDVHSFLVNDSLSVKNCLLLDEFAFVPENMAEEFYASTFPTISSGKTTKIIMTSTPNGMNKFHKFWVDATSDPPRNDFKPIFVHWTDVPGRDEKWKQDTIRNIGGPDIFEAEYNCSFLSSSYTLLSPQCLSSLTFDKPILENPDGYKEFVAPIKGHIYTLTVDTATGQKKDSSAFTIIDVTSMPYRVVATYANNEIKTMEYPRVIMEYAKKYFFPYVFIEINDIGRDIANILFHEFSYPCLLSIRMGDKRHGQKLAFGNGANRQLGLRMTTGVKRSGCAIMKALIENGQLIVSDHRIIKELSTFVQNGRIYEAQPNQHDDHVMTLVIFAWLSLQPGFGEITNTRSLSEYTQIIEAANEESSETIGENSLEPAEPPLPFYNPQTEELSPDMWLLYQICK